MGLSMSFSGIQKQIESIVSAIRKISQIEQKSDLWRQKKQKIITATEVATLMNKNPFQKINSCIFDIKNLFPFYMCL